MAGIERFDFDSPEDSRTLDKTKLDRASAGGVTLARATFQPGWRWSEAVKPVVGTDQCEVHHLGVLLAGRLHVVHSDGSEAEIAAGDVYNIQPGHDAWVVGDEAVVGVEFDPTSVETYAKA